MAAQVGVKLALRACLALFLIVPPTAFAADSQVGEPFFSYHVVNDSSEPRGLFWRPAFSFLLPGFDQWMEGQYRSAMVYSGYAAVGFSVAASATNSSVSSDVGDETDNNARRYVWGNQAYMDVGFVSAFHSFRKAAETKRADGRFLFLNNQETTGDLLLAPFRFDYLLRPSVFIPIGLALAFAVGGPHSVWRGDDVLFGTATALNAGVGEEAMFRGYMMPVMREYWGSDFWSNTASATLFSAAHISSSNPVPWPQFIAGFYFGWKVQHDDWKLSQAVFLHTWWDIILLTAELASNRGESAYLPVIHAEF